MGIQETIVTKCIIGREERNIGIRGERIGPFVVHSQKQMVAAGCKNWRGDGWSVTHVATGFSACPSVPNKRCAMHAAVLLNNLPVNWDFSEPATVKEWPKEVIDQVTIIRAAARCGVEA